MCVCQSKRRRNSEPRKSTNRRSTPSTSSKSAAAKAADPFDALLNLVQVATTTSKETGSHSGKSGKRSRAARASSSDDDSGSDSSGTGTSYDSASDDTSGSDSEASVHSKNVKKHASGRSNARARAPARHERANSVSSTSSSASIEAGTSRRPTPREKEKERNSTKKLKIDHSAASRLGHANNANSSAFTVKSESKPASTKHSNESSNHAFNQPNKAMLPPAALPISNGPTPFVSAIVPSTAPMVAGAFPSVPISPLIAVGGVPVALLPPAGSTEPAPAAPLPAPAAPTYITRAQAFAGVPLSAHKRAFRHAGIAYLIYNRRGEIPPANPQPLLSTMTMPVSAQNVNLHGLNPFVGFGLAGLPQSHPLITSASTGAASQASDAGMDLSLMTALMSDQYQNSIANLPDHQLTHQQLQSRMIWRERKLQAQLAEAQGHNSQQAINHSHSHDQQIAAAIMQQQAQQQQQQFAMQQFAAAQSAQAFAQQQQAQQQQQSQQQHQSQVAQQQAQAQQQQYQQLQLQAQAQAEAHAQQQMQAQAQAQMQAFNSASNPHQQQFLLHSGGLAAAGTEVTKTEAMGMKTPQLTHATPGQSVLVAAPTNSALPNQLALAASQQLQAQNSQQVQQAQQQLMMQQMMIHNQAVQQQAQAQQQHTVFQASLLQQQQQQSPGQIPQNSQQQLQQPVMTAGQHPMMQVMQQHTLQQMQGGQVQQHPHGQQMMVSVPMQQWQINQANQGMSGAPMIVQAQPFASNGITYVQQPQSMFLQQQPGQQIGQSIVQPNGTVQQHQQVALQQQQPPFGFTYVARA